MKFSRAEIPDIIIIEPMFLQMKGVISLSHLNKMN